MRRPPLSWFALPLTFGPEPAPMAVYCRNMSDLFRRFAHRTSARLGSPIAFFVACMIIVGWGLTGPLFHFSDTWQLVINTRTTIIPFLMVFLIQNTQNRDALAMHLKLDELIRALGGARNKLVNLEEMSDEKLDELQHEFEKVCGARRGQKEEVARGKN